VIAVDDLKTKKPEEMIDALAYTVSGLICTARIAAENDGARTVDGASAHHARLSFRKP